MKYLKISVLPILILFLLNSAFLKAQTNKFANSLFWEISGNGLKQSSYIFGTLHIIPNKDFFMPKVVTDKFKNCKAFALEIELDIPFSKQFELAQLAILPDGTLISDYMDSTTYISFRNFYLDSTSISESEFDRLMRFKPYFSVGLFTQKMLGKTKVYDKYFYNKAKKMKLIILPLETLDDQINVLEQIPIDIQCKSFFGSTNPRADYNQMLISYKNQDINTLADLSDDSLLGPYEKILLENRNKKWIPELVKILAEQSTFIAVGAGHLAGENGVLTMLQKQGYTIRPITFNTTKN